MNNTSCQAHLVPTIGHCLPSGQAVQVAAPYPAAKVPAMQGLHDELPLYEEYPGAHETQNVACPSEIVPAGQVCSQAWREGKNQKSRSMQGVVSEIYPSSSVLPCKMLRLGCCCTALERIRHTSELPLCCLQCRTDKRCKWLPLLC